MDAISTNAVETKLAGYFSPDYSSDELTVIDVTGQTPVEGMMPADRVPPVIIGDGRLLQDQENDGSTDFEAKFFANHGFVLLPHKSSVDDWDSGMFPPTDGLNVGGRKYTPPSGENQVVTRYVPEIDEIVRNVLLPGERIEIDQPPGVLRRGPNTPNPFFGITIHNDYGLNDRDFEENSAAFGSLEMAQSWRKRFDSERVRGFMIVNFWRTVHMSEPLMHVPLAILDGSSVELDDCVSTGLKGFSPTGRITNQLSLRYNPDQRWFYYPRMTVDEVLALKLFHYFKDDREQRFKLSYHSAFENPHAPSDAEERQSCEHRISIWILND